MSDSLIFSVRHRGGCTAAGADPDWCSCSPVVCVATGLEHDERPVGVLPAGWTRRDLVRVAVEGACR
jgi:hypothetical protein